MGTPSKKSKSKSVAPDVPTLTRDDWLDEAYMAVVEGGFESVKVMALAEKLKVTRGSFYWHFTDHADLIQSLLIRWKQEQLALDARLKSNQTGDPVKDLDAVVKDAFCQAGKELENLQFEQALRALGRRNPETAKLLIEVDAERMALLQAKFMDIVKDQNKARDLAALLYLALAGSYQAMIRPANPSNIRDYLRGLISHYLVQKQVS